MDTCGGASTIFATFGGNYASPGSYFVQMTVVPRDLLPAVREPGDDKHAPVVARADYTPKPMGSQSEAGRITPPR